MPFYRSVSAPTDALQPGAPRPGALASSFTRAEWRRLSALYAVVALLHVLGWGLYLHAASRVPALVGLGFVAYLLGLRHAFDPDHIAAVDDTVRYLQQKGARPLSVGFWFSLGHASVVCALALAIVLAASTIRTALPALQHGGALIGAAVSGGFLWLIGLLNLAVLLDVLRVARRARAGTHDHAHLEQLLARRGLVNRVFGARLRRVVTRSWQMYPLGLLFGLSFDTASEIGMLAMTVGASAADMPIAAVMSLPVLFTAGMTMMDTTDGVLMTKAYDWAFVNPLRKIFYNVAITALSVVVALVVGTVELLQVLVALTGSKGPVADGIVGLDFGMLGCAIVGLFMLAWAVSVAIPRLGRIEQRCGGEPSSHAHLHAHDDGVTHAHRHFH